MRNRRRQNLTKSSPATTQKKYENPHDPEQRPAREFGCVTPVVENGKTVAKCHSFFMEDIEQSVNLVEYPDGTFQCYIEDFSDVNLSDE
jgi:hypothetical protein